LTIDSTRLSIMRELWYDQRSGATAGLTQAQLAGRIHVTTQDISKFISQLLHDGLIIGGRAIRNPDQKGATPRSYKIDTRRVIASPCTARLVLRLSEVTHDGIAYPRQRLLKDIIALGILNPNLNEPFAEADVEDMFDFACNAGYIEEVGGARLLPTTRASEEAEYLRFLTSQVAS
jgi:DNA-binding Lrp family transcriptional regulator